MKNYFKISLLFLIIAILHSCNASKNNEVFTPKIVYQTDELILTQLTKNSYQHTSYLQTNSFGKVNCNGLLVFDNDEAFIFDTPANSKSTLELISWIEKEKKSKIVGVVATHFHNDCLAGLQEFHDKKIPSYAHRKTIEIATKEEINTPQKSFEESLVINVGKKKAIARYFGEGHTKDNTIGYFPSENIMFGGCLIKEVGANKGNLDDANLERWSKTVESVKLAYPNAKIVIPGHGKFGNSELLDYTITLFKSS